MKSSEPTDDQIATGYEFYRETERQQQRLASVLQFDSDAHVCPACGVLIYPADTLKCHGVPNCMAQIP